jgi:hypothetical protein
LVITCSVLYTFKYYDLLNHTIDMFNTTTTPTKTNQKTKLNLKKQFNRKERKTKNIDLSTKLIEKFEKQLCDLFAQLSLQVILFERINALAFRKT